jgi:Fe-S-cluster-containing hydrogenase component 2
VLAYHVDFVFVEFDPEECPTDCPRPCEVICPAEAISFKLVPEINESGTSTSCSKLEVLLGSLVD